jgi:hypothetical protein
MARAPTSHKHSVETGEEKLDEEDEVCGLLLSFPLLGDDD